MKRCCGVNYKHPSAEFGTPQTKMKCGVWAKFHSTQKGVYKLYTGWFFLTPPPPNFSTKKKTENQPITALDLLEQHLWLADWRFSFWYWNWGGTVKKTTLYKSYKSVPIINELYVNCASSLQEKFLSMVVLGSHSFKGSVWPMQMAYLIQICFMICICLEQVHNVQVGGRLEKGWVGLKNLTS